MKLRLMLDAVLDFVYPQIYCICCGRMIEKKALHGICPNCCESMPFIHEPRCSLCGRPLEQEQGMCRDCSLYGHDYSRAMSVFEYSIAIRELIHRYKYYGEYNLSRTFAWFMSDLLDKSGWKADMIIPVPLHRNRLKSRGFNQAALLGDYISYRHKIPCYDDILVRTADTKSQTGFNKAMRMQNLKNAFAVAKPDYVQDKNILLVDDVYTTGATADSCSRELRFSGAGNIYVLTIAAAVLVPEQ